MTVESKLKLNQEGVWFNLTHAPDELVAKSDVIASRVYGRQ